MPESSTIAAPARETRDDAAAGGLIRWERDADGIVVLTFDDRAHPVNIVSAAWIASFAAAVAQLERERDDITGVVLTSAKSTFVTGSDLRELAAFGPGDRRAAFEWATALKNQLRRLETLGRPVVAALNGAALGAGLEIALACHHRIAADVAGSQFGLPEVTLGLMPCGGGVARTVRLLGVRGALYNVLLAGQRYGPAQAAAVGLVDRLVGSPGELLPAAKAWIRANPEPVVRWDAREIPGGTPTSPALAAVLPTMPAGLVRQLRGAHAPAPHAIMAAAVEGAQVDIDTAFVVESRYFADVVTGQVAKNMIQAFYVDMGRISSGISRPAGPPPFKATKVAVVGAGPMGAALGYMFARAGVDVVLKAADPDAAADGRQQVEKLVSAAVRRGSVQPAASAGLLGRVTATDQVGELAGADVVVTVADDDQARTPGLLAEIQDAVGPDALLCSGTAGLSATGVSAALAGLAGAVGRPQDVVGLHFLAPADRAGLVEIVAGERTSPAALARAVDVVNQVRRTPIVVSDGPGLFTSRVRGAYLAEALAMVGEGLHPASVEQAAAQAGYPVPALALVDDLGLAAVRRELQAIAAAADGVWRDHRSFAVLARMLDTLSRPGRPRPPAAGSTSDDDSRPEADGGFYTYGPDGRRGPLWPGLREQFMPARGAAADAVDLAELTERLLFAPVLEAVRCLDEGVPRSVPEANVGSLTGIGFPAWTGGVAQFVNGYPGGLPGFVARARELADRHGAHLAPPPSLLARAEDGTALA
ncbi:MAG: enoyl-CoA hydratase/isomerase family protein [Frankia sp.]|nr:enoyl-CoA hydratase/isomerase family protein [Frankia sp.]